MYVLHATRKLLTRLGRPGPDRGQESTTVLGDWYATVVFSSPPLALAVNESTLLPVLLPLDPALTVPDRFPQALAQVLDAHQAPRAFVEHETAQMTGCRLATTSNRSVVGIMIEFSHLLDVYRGPEPEPDLLGLSLRLARTPCSPLYTRRITPEGELAAVLAHLDP